MSIQLVGHISVSVALPKVMLFAVGDFFDAVYSEHIVLVKSGAHNCMLEDTTPLATIQPFN